MRKNEATCPNREKIRKERYKKVENGKGRKIRFFEAIDLKIKGFFDGRNGFPRQNQDNEWYSPFMNRELNSFEEFCSHTWGSLQIENEEKYAMLRKMIDGIYQKNEKLESARADLEKACEAYSTASSPGGFVRKKGEASLTEAQVRVRREAEKEKKISSINNRVARLEHELKSEEEAFSGLHSRLIENDNTTRLICSRVQNHMQMRLDVYWNSVLKHHKDNISMPIVPVLEFEDKVENIYLKSHQELMSSANIISSKFVKKTASEEV